MQFRCVTVTLPVILSIMIVTLTSCGKAPAPNTEASLEAAELTVAAPFGESDGRYGDYISLVSEFEQSTGVKVTNELPPKSSEEWKINVVDSFDTKTEPDVMFFFIGGTVDPILDKVIDLDTIRNEYPDYAVNINLGVLNSMKASDGKNYCVPTTGFWEGMFINRDLFDNNDIKVPENFDEFKTAVEKFNLAGITPMAANLTDTPHYLFEYLIYNYTGPDLHTYAVDERDNYERWVNGLNMFKTLYDMGAFPKDVIDDDTCINMFINKDAAMMVDGSWSPAVSADNDTEVVYFPVLRQEGETNRKTTDIIGGFSMGYYVTKKGWENNKAASVDFVKFMTGEHALSVFNKSGSASPSQSVSSTDETGILGSINEMVGNSTAFTPAIQDTFLKEAREQLFSQIMSIAKGEVKAEDALNTFIETNK